ADQRVVEHIDGLSGEWGAGFNPKFPPGAGRKWLRRDPVTGDETWILGTMPLRHGTRPERHPVVEEMYLLSGELHGHVGVMRPGAYFWRPPEEWHGPFGSLTGNLMLFRTVGGPLSTVYDDAETEFAWDPPARPILPPELAALPPYQPAGCACY
ncbi:MAG: cupin domain-containing protein, partial [Micromonosporaceae bacterium]